MKKNMYLLVSGIIAVSFLFGSCKSLTNFSIEKRQHRGGYYVDWGNGKVKTDPVKSAAVVKQQKDAQKKTADAKTTPTPNVKRETAAAVEQSGAKSTSQTAQKQSSDKAYSKNSFEVKEEPVAEKASASNKSMSSLSYKFNDSGTEGSSGTPTWVLAVLCILLPPLAVFLAMGIGTEFWISLILTLIFWIPGVIYAFVVIF